MAEAHDAMEQRAALIAAGDAPECVWLLEHPPLYTAGEPVPTTPTLSTPTGFRSTGRGAAGSFTYHGPGQRVAYAMLDLKRRRPDVRRYVCAPRRLDHRHAGSVQYQGRASGGPRRCLGRGVQKKGTDREDKIAAIGVRVRRWVTFHGISLNVDPDLSHYNGIVPCGDCRIWRNEPGRSRPDRHL